MRTSIFRLTSRTGVALLVAFFAAQLVPYGRDHVNPAIRSEPAWDSPDTRALAKQACFDCHSNETDWPAYSHLAPASWLVQYDVDEGREALNFSEWHRNQDEATEAAEKVLEGEMPPVAYRLMHGHARLNGADRERLARGPTSTVHAARRETNAAHRRSIAAGSVRAAR